MLTIIIIMHSMLQFIVLISDRDFDVNQPVGVP